MRRIPQAAGVYLAVLQFVFALGWTSYAFYLPKLAGAVGLSSAAVGVILMLDQIIFTVTDFSMGIAADKVSRVLGRLGHWVAGVTFVSCLAFVGLPFIAAGHLGAVPFLALTVIMGDYLFGAAGTAADAAWQICGAAGHPLSGQPCHARALASPAQCRPISP